MQSSLIAELERTLTISVELANSFRSTAIESLMDQSWERASQGWSLVGAMASKYGESCRLGLEDLLSLTQSALRGLESRRLPSIGEVLAVVCRGALASKEHELLQVLPAYQTNLCIYLSLALTITTTKIKVYSCRA